MMYFQYDKNYMCIVGNQLTLSAGIFGSEASLSQKLKAPLQLYPEGQLILPFKRP